MRMTGMGASPTNKAHSINTNDFILYGLLFTVYPMVIKPSQWNSDVKEFLRALCLENEKLSQDQLHAKSSISISSGGGCGGYGGCGGCGGCGGGGGGGGGSGSSSRSSKNARTTATAA